MKTKYENVKAGEWVQPQSLDMAAMTLLNAIKSWPDMVPKGQDGFKLPADADWASLATDPSTGIQVLIVIRMGRLTVHSQRLAKRTERTRRARAKG